MILKQNVGIDVSMDKFDANFSSINSSLDIVRIGYKTFPNTSLGFIKFLEWINNKKKNQVDESYTLEFTGVYHENLAYFLKENGKTVHMVIPSKSKKYIESLSRASKTDKLDAQSLAWLGLERKLKEWSPLSNLFQPMRALTREREEILKEKTILTNRLHALDKKAIKNNSTKKRLQSRLSLLFEQLKELEIELKDLVEGDEKLQKKINVILTIKGVGFVCAATVIAETNGFASITNQKQLTSYAGYDVKLKESGKYKGQSKISKQGNAHIRRVMHFPAQSAIIHNQIMTDYYNRVNAKKHKAMIAGVGVQRKLLNLIYAIWKSGQVFNPQYEANKNRMANKLPSYAG